MGETGVNGKEAMGAVRFDQSTLYACVDIKYNILKMQSLGIFKKMYFVCIFVSMYVCLVTRGQKRVLDHLVLGLQTKL